MFGFLKNLGGNSGPSTEELKEHKANGATFLDVRTPAEYAEGHIDGAPNIAVQILADHIQRVKDMPQPIIIYCRSGGRAGTALSMLSNHGIEAYNAGGFHTLNEQLNS